MNKKFNQITNSIYTNLRALDIWVGNLVKVTNTSAYYKKFKNRKCYNCGLYGHASKDCGQTCIYCHNIHNNNICFKQFIHMANKIGSIFVHSGLEGFLQNLPKFNFINFNKKSYEKISKEYGAYLKNYKEKQIKKQQDKENKNKEDYKDDVNKFYLENPPQKLENNPVYGLLTMIKFACRPDEEKYKNGKETKEENKNGKETKEENFKNGKKTKEDTKKEQYKFSKREKSYKQNKRDNMKFNKKRTTRKIKNINRREKNSKEGDKGKEDINKDKKEYNYEKEINLILKKIKKKNIRSRKIKENIFLDLYKDFYNNKINIENIKNGIVIQNKIDHIKNSLKYKEKELNDKVDKVIKTGIDYERLKNNFNNLKLCFDDFRKFDNDIKDEIKDRQQQLKIKQQMLKRIAKLEEIIKKKRAKISDIQAIIDIRFRYLDPEQTGKIKKRDQLINLINQIESEIEDLEEEISDLYRNFN